MRNRIVSGILCFLMVIGNICVNVEASSPDNLGGYVTHSYIAIEDDNNTPKETKGSEIYSKVLGLRDVSYWEKFSDYTLYNNMNSTEQRFYNSLKQQCDILLTTNKDAVSQKALVNNKEVYVNVVPRVSIDGLSERRALQIYILMANSNPQYYFLSGSMLFTEDKKWCYPVFYDRYADGDIRAQYSDKLSETLDRWVNEASAGLNKYDKAKIIFDLLCREFSYATGSWDPHQSIATAVFDKKTVCAGYAECYAIIARAVGIPVVVITSKDHEWVLLKLDDYWYNCDATYGDKNTGPDYRYFAKSDSSIRKYDRETEGHVREEVYYSLNAPKALYDWENRPVNSVSENPPAVTPNTQGNTMYRLYNPNSHEHFYTADVNERNTLSKRGWQYEGIAWKAPTTSSAPVYRLYFPGSGDHHYTTSINERNVLVSGFGWRYEGIGWYSSEKTGTPLYRLNNPNLRVGAHHYTADVNEVNVLRNRGWRYEGIGWYGN